MTMKDWIIKMFSDDRGNFSTMRVIFVVWMLWSIFMGTTVWFHTHEASTTIAVTSALSGIGIGLKFGQNAQENNKNK